MKSKTLEVKYSDAVIKRHLDDNGIRQLKDPRYPLRLRFHLDRTAASWFVVKYAKGRTIWRKLGNWPELTTKALLNKLPEIQAELARDLDSQNVSQSFHSLADLLGWYQERALSDRNLSKTRKSAIKSAISRHLLPRLAHHAIQELNHAELDEYLFWPLQSEYSLAYVRSIWAVLKQAFKRAHKLKMVANNPVAGYQFSDFIESPITPKPSAIRSDEVAALLSDLRPIKHDKLMLVLMMLMHGTRIGETRRARWEHISLSERRWFIPAEHTKTKQEHTLPLTDQAVALLRLYREQQKIKGYEGVNIFPNSTKRKPLNGNQANTLIKSVSESQWQSHDLRKVARTIWMDLGTDYMVGELLLNHAMSKLDQTYIHTFAEAQKRQALEQYHAWLAHQGLFFFLKNTTETIPRQPDHSISQQAVNGGLSLSK